jgi:hypothetical protein
MSSGAPPTFAYDDYRTEILLDMPSFGVENRFANRSPRYFPFHNRCVPEAEWHPFVNQVHCLWSLLMGLESIEDAGLEANELIAMSHSIADEIGDLRAVSTTMRRAMECDLAMSLLSSTMTNA